MSGMADNDHALVLRAQRRSALIYPSLLVGAGALFALTGFVGTSVRDDLKLKTALITLGVFWGWAGLWYLYCRIRPGRVCYVAGDGFLEARRGRRVVRHISSSEIVDVEWGLPTYDWSGMMTAPFGATMPRLLVVVAGKSRWDSRRVEFPPICVWGEDPLDAYANAVRETLDVG